MELAELIFMVLSILTVLLCLAHNYQLDLDLELLQKRVDILTDNFFDAKERVLHIEETILKPEELERLTAALMQEVYKRRVDVQ